MRLMLFAIALGVAGGSCESGEASLGPSFACRDRPGDSTGYLKPICEYVATNFDSYPVDPNELEIERIESGDEVEYTIEGYDTADSDYVYLSCCYTGDVAVMSVESKRVRAFHLGDK